MVKTQEKKCARVPDIDKVIQIAGAGPSGLAAAITLAHAGLRVIVSEAQSEVGHRFQRDLQGLENWTTKQDVLSWLHGHGLTTDFEMLACHHGTAFDAQGKPHEINSPKPLFYLLERGPEQNSLDHALLTQARELGVEVRFNNRINYIEGDGILAIGPKAADAIAVGYHFDTDMENGFWVICDDNLAPKGYAYLLVMNGRGTVKSCMFSGFKQEQLYVERTIKTFKRLVGLKMLNPRPHGGVGNFLLPSMVLHGGHPVVGEQAGFQDTLWGFGMRYAIYSGILAAQSLLTGSDYEAMWKRELRPQLETSVVNRALYGLLGNPGYRFILAMLAGNKEPRAVLRHHYNPIWIKRLILPWARSRYSSRRKNKSCNHADCTCVWCRGEGTGDIVQ